MDLFGQYNDAVIELFEENEYLSGGNAAATLYAQDSEDETEEQVLTKINARLNEVGAVGTFHGMRIEGQEGDRVVCRGGIFWEINKKKNQSATGTQKPGRLIWQESVAILKRFSPVIEDDAANQFKPFSMATIKAAERIGEDEGVELWMIDFETRIAL